MNPKRSPRWITWTLLSAGVLVLVLWIGGALREREHASEHAGGAAALPAPPERTVVTRETVPALEEVVGTVDSRRRVVVAARVTSRIVEITAAVGETVARGAPLVVLESAEVVARLGQAQAHYRRLQGFQARGAATAAELEAAEADYLQAKAAVEHTRIAAPIDGVVAERPVEPGDLAWPGRPLLTVLDARALRLEAQVREGLIGRVRVGARLDVTLPALGTTAHGTVAEVLPAADPATRTFTVRVNLDPVVGLYPGMFGRVGLPAGAREVVRVPARAIVRVGQLETVVVQVGDRWERRLVTTGRTFGDGAIEVLSGLAGGETVGLAAADGADGR